MSLTDLIDQAKTLAESLCEDTCSIVDPTSTNDGWGRQSPGASSTVLSDIPCLYEPFGDQMVAVAGTTMPIIDHKIYLAVSSESLTIKPDYKIVVDARGDKPALTFESPRRLTESYEALITVAAKLRL